MTAAPGRAVYPGRKEQHEEIHLGQKGGRTADPHRLEISNRRYRIDTNVHSIGRRTQW